MNEEFGPLSLAVMVIMGLVAVRMALRKPKARKQGNVGIIVPVGPVYGTGRIVLGYLAALLLTPVLAVVTTVLVAWGVRMNTGWAVIGGNLGLLFGYFLNFFVCLPRGYFNDNRKGNVGDLLGGIMLLCAMLGQMVVMWPWAVG